MTREDARSRVIVALDVSEVGMAQTLVSLLNGKVGGFKVGFEFVYSMFTTMMTTGFEEAVGLLVSLRSLFRGFNGKEFVDCKLADIPNTVAGAIRAICRLQPLMFNMHAFTGRKAMMAARKTVNEMATVLNLEHKPLLLAVTVLTSQDGLDLEELGSPEGTSRVNLVTRYAKLAQDCGCDGVIASPLEVAAIRAACGPDFKIFTPGVRLSGSGKQDQKAVDLPGKSIGDGANGVIVGRDITTAADPAAALELVVDDILAHTQKEV